jgi:hypothetical protein
MISFQRRYDPTFAPRRSSPPAVNKPDAGRHQPRPGAAVDEIYWNLEGI